MKKDPLLLVEDDPDIQENLREFLEQEGFEVQIVGNGQEALSYLDSGKPARAVLLDLMMPVMDGYEFLDRYFSSSPKPNLKGPIIVVSASPDVVRVAAERNLPYVRKPIDLDRLTQLLGPV